MTPASIVEVQPARATPVPGLDAIWMLHNITLNGNLFRDSHSVDKEPLVAHVGYGVAFLHRRWKFALARRHNSREFEGQKETPVFGGFTISRTF